MQERFAPACIRKDETRNVFFMLGWTLGGSICSFSSDFLSPREPAPRPEILLSRFLVHWKGFSNYLFVCRKWPSTFPFRWRGGGEEIPKLTRAGDAGSGRPNFFCTTRRIDTWGHSPMKTTVTWCRGSKTLGAGQSVSWPCVRQAV